MFETDTSKEKSDFIWLDGEFVPKEEAKIHIATECVMRGANVFEGVRAYWNEDEQELFIFRAQEHMDRLFDVSMKLMRMTIPYSKQDLIDISIELLKRNGYKEDVHMRPTVYFGTGKNFGFRPEDIFTGAFIRAGAQPIRATLEKGINCCISSWVRISDRSVPPRIKAGANYQNNRLALYEAHLNGYNSTIILTEHGKVAEGHGACLFMIRNGTPVTPSLTQGILEGITRDTVLELFGTEFGLDVIEREIDRTELYVADEVFLCGTNMEITPIVSIDKYPIGSGSRGPVTAQVQEKYFGAVRGTDKSYRHWLTPVFRPKETELRSAV